ncbi:DUF2218 domain-containing protein [Kribbella sp. NPDC026611]|uniref:DUF2218 domain-containing protein n=1 Tax=Kribbella sp. NPDC026611 TaxID=3154911 RepID=UPI0033D4A058
MPVLEAHVSTGRADRYLGQLSSHLGHGPGGLTVVSSAADNLVVDLGQATWTIRATPAELVLRLEAGDSDTLAEQAARVAQRIETLGRRDALKVDWLPGD